MSGKIIPINPHYQFICRSHQLAFNYMYIINIICPPVMHDSGSGIGIDSGISHISAGIGINKVKLGWNRNRNQGLRPWNRNRNQGFPFPMKYWTCDILKDVPTLN